MAGTKSEQLTGYQKAAILMIAIGPDASAYLYKNLEDHEVEQITKEVVSLRSISSEIIEDVVNEFHQMVLAQEYIASGGINFAQEILERAVGPEKAMEIIKKIQRLLKVKGFNILKNVDPNQLLSFIQKEHPQTIAFVLTQLNPIQAAQILSELNPELQTEVVFRFANMERVSPDTINSVEHVLESRIDFSQSTSKLGGVRSVAEILNLVGQTNEKQILSRLAEEDPDLATEIKNLMFTFEDLILLDGRSIQKLLKEIDNKDLIMALKHVSNEVKDLILGNMSERAAEMIDEEIEYLGAVRLKDVEEAQQRIVDVVRKLEEEGLVTIVGGDRGETMVE